MKNENIDKFEQLELEFTQTRFVKSFSMLTKLDITDSEKALIELIHSFTVNGQDFYMNYSDIAYRLNIKQTSSISNMVGHLKKLNYITNNPKPYGVGRGSSSTLTVNDDVIISDLKKILEVRKTSTPIEDFKASTPTEKPIEPTTPIKDKPRLKVVKSEPVAKIEPIETPQQVEPVTKIEKSLFEELEDIVDSKVKNNVKMYKENQQLTTNEALEILQPKLNHIKYIKEYIERYNGQIIGGEQFLITPTNLKRLVKMEYPDLIPNIEKRIAV